MKSLILKNDFIRIEILPEYGGKMVSLKSMKTKKEFLFQSEKKTLVTPPYGASFSEYDSSGFDEVFPSIDETFYPTGSWKGISIPDHGEVWTLPWESNLNNETIELLVKSRKFPYILKKKIKIIENKVHIEYLVENYSREEFVFIWAAHSLLNCDSKTTKVLMPDSVDKIINVEKGSQNLKGWGYIYDYPIVNTGIKTIDFSKIQPKSANNVEKYYVFGDLKEGWCGLEYGDVKERLIYEYPLDKIPYLGVWKTQGGYRGDYNIALEPCSGIYDDLYLGNKIGKVSKIKANEKYNWHLDIKIEGF